MEHFVDKEGEALKDYRKELEAYLPDATEEEIQTAMKYDLVPVHVAGDIAALMVKNKLTAFNTAQAKRSKLWGVLQGCLMAPFAFKIAATLVAVSSFWLWPVAIGMTVGTVWIINKTIEETMKLGMGLRAKKKKNEEQKHQ